MRTSIGLLIACALAHAYGFTSVPLPLRTAARSVHAASMSEAAPTTSVLLAARSGGRVGGRVGGGGGGRMGGGGGRVAAGGGVTNVYMAPPMFSPFGFGFSPFGFSPFGFGFGFGLPGPLLFLALGGLALTSFRSVRGIDVCQRSIERPLHLCIAQC